MNPLYLDGSDDTPKVVLDPEKNIFEFTGRSIPHNPNKFYTPIVEWFLEYAKEPNTKTEVTFKMDYFNTASSKMLLDIFEKIEVIYKSGSDITILWYHDEDDVDMEEAGEEYSEIVEVPIKLITI